MTNNNLKIKEVCAQTIVTGMTSVAVVSLMPLLFTIGIFGYAGLACVKAGKVITATARGIKNNK
jgi:hypothetical protein